jgi:hypothetical protein
VRVLCGLLLTGFLCAQSPFYPLRDVRAGMNGVGRTVFSGSRVEDFQVEVLGVLDNVGPKQSLILVRLSGGPLASTGVLQGMSGSPVFIDGKLLGAVAMAFAFAKEPIAAVRPIEDMLAAGAASPARPPSRAGLWDGQLARLLPRREDVLAGGSRLIDIATPVSFGGFTRNTLEHFAAQLRELGLEPRQGMTGGGRVPTPAMGNPASIEPGSMISVQLLTGDMSVGADGTVTYIDPRGAVYAFGHRFLATGATDMPFARADVITLLPNLSTSFKISAPREWMGSITEDRSTAVAGRIGRPARTIPLSISVVPHEPGGRTASYRMQMVNDSVLSPFLLQTAVFSAIDATERTTGESSFAIRGRIDFADGAAPLKVDNMYAGDLNLAAQASMATAVPVAYVMQSGFPSLALKSVDLTIESFSHKRTMQIDQIWASRREVKPGETVEITVVLSGDDGAELTRKVAYRVPVGAPAGPLQFTAADATTTNFTEFRQLLAIAPKSPVQLLSFVNGLRPNTKAYVRVWRADPTYDVQGETLADPPPSLALILARSQPSLSAIPAPPNSKVAEFEIGAGEMVVSGSKTIQVEVKD